MQEERNSGSGFYNRDSFYQRIHSNVSIDRFTKRSHSPTMNHKTSLIQAMDIEISDRKSDFYEKILGDHFRNSSYNRQSSHKRESGHKRESNVQIGQRNSKIQRQQQNQGQMADEDNNNHYSTHKYIHECNCQKQCNLQHCSCFLYPNQLCLIGLCCLSCVKLKNQFLTKQSIQIITNGCFCKNIKCLKMYCSCYRNGKKCNSKLCKCQGCQNNKKRKKVQSQFKKQFFLNSRQNHHLINKQTKVKIDPLMYQFSNCSCKKSHCLKKYCTCFLNNKSCNQSCLCQDCHNKFDDQQERYRKARYGRHDVDIEEHGKINQIEQIDQFLEDGDDFQNEELPDKMQFEPVNFENI